MLFVVLDVYRHCDVNEKPQNWDWTLGKTQYDWFKQTLETSKAKYKLVFGHHTRGQGRGALTTATGFEWGGMGTKNTYEFDTYRPGWGLPIHQLMVKNGVNIFFQGHNHLFAKESLDGLVYQETPMACDSTYTIGVLANADAYTDVTLDGSGHLLVSVSPDAINVDYIRAYLPADTKDGRHKNGEVAYSYTISAGKQSTPTPPLVLGVDNKLVADDVKVYPNPTFDKLRIELPRASYAGDFTVLDAQGRQVLKSQLPELDMSGFASGTYFLQITTATWNVTKKIVISH